ncbi:MAG: hypothetical protein JJE52_06490 [Acidimicrobiia bacterium]|nr:hypothetical protein [Acidimicrobiia bacterium]
MGVIRKTLSIGTLGLVSFRSKKERLRRAEGELADAERELEKEHKARDEADSRVESALKRAKRAELDALHEAQVATKERRRRKRGKRAKKATAAAMVAAKPDRHRSKRSARKAMRADEVATRARRRIDDVEKAMGPRLEAASGKAKHVKDDAVGRTHAMAAQVRERAEELAKDRR